MTFVSQLDPQASSWFDRSSFEVQQCRTPSTAAAFRLRWRNRTATTFPPPSSTMSNSIDQLYVKSSLVEFHQHLSKVECPSTMSNSIDSSIAITMVTPTDYNVELHRLFNAIQSCVQFRDSSGTIKHGELSSCAIHTLNTCNLTSNAA